MSFKLCQLTTLERSTLPRSTKLKGSESHEIPVSAPCLSNTKPLIGRTVCSQLIFDTKFLLLVELLTIFFAESTTLLLDIELELSSELSFLAERTGETYQHKKSRDHLCISPNKHLLIGSLIFYHKHIKTVETLKKLEG